MIYATMTCAVLWLLAMAMNSRVCAVGAVDPDDD
jgi:hypothetical protein